jgi:hypothetical protein
MVNSVRTLLQNLEPDPWRAATGFSPAFHEAQEALLSPAIDDNERIAVVSDWLQKHQPCLFGRIAAKNGFLSYCILNETDLQGSDELIRDKIQAARKSWTRSAFNGATSGFIIVCLNRNLALAKPSQVVKELACRLASLYLLVDVAPDQIFMDDIFLEKPGREGTTWKWNAGVNYFSAHGDQRWWHDHRFPGGIAFSINSVGHMVKSGIIARSMKDLDDALGAPSEGWEVSKIESLPKAHEVALRTIHMASEAISGKATILVNAPIDANGEPISGPLQDLPKFLFGKDQSQYFGYYHTDYTVPSEYFLPDVERPKGLQGHVLDFTYLFEAGIDNPDYITLGTGRPIREDQTGVDQIAGATRERKMKSTEVRLDTEQRLIQAIGQP